MKGKKLLVTLAVSAMLFTGCGLKGGNAIIKVNDTKITQGQFEQKMNEALGSSVLSKMGVDLKNGKNAFLLNLIKVRVINDLIVKALLEDEMKKRGVKISNKDVEEGVKGIVDKMGSKEQLNNVLKQNGITPQQFKEQVADQVRVQKLAEQLGDTSVSDAEAQKFYKDNISRFKYPEQVKASHILVAANVKDIEEMVKAENEGISEADLKAKVSKIRAEKKVLAHDILAEVKKDPSQFAKIAKEKSQDPGSATMGGDLGFFPRGKMVAPFEKAAFSMKPNSVSDVVETHFGYHIIYVYDRKEAGQEPFEKVQRDIKEYLKNKKQVELVDNLVESLKKNATIEYVDPEYNPDEIQDAVQRLIDPEGPEAQAEKARLEKEAQEKAKSEKKSK